MLEKTMLRNFIASFSSEHLIKRYIENMEFGDELNLRKKQLLEDRKALEIELKKRKIYKNSIKLYKTRKNTKRKKNIKVFIKNEFKVIT